jgi:chaperonin cofactor prefoldin
MNMMKISKQVGERFYKPSQQEYVKELSGVKEGIYDAMC